MNLSTPSSRLAAALSRTNERTKPLLPPVSRTTLSGAMQRTAPPVATLVIRVIRRAHSAAAGNAAAGAAAAQPSTAVGGKAAPYWMRDPKTGHWIPEDRFGEVDAAELRERLLPRNRRQTQKTEKS